jgi:ferric-dicitrate binding protein FerR (iron transport regulator)
MSDCQTFRELIDEYLDGTISAARRQELEAHARTCRDCAEHLRGSRLMQNVIADAFVAGTAAREAKDELLAKLADRRQPLRERNLMVGVRWAVAAGVILAAGLSLGFALGRSGSAEPESAQLGPPVPMQVADLGGTVLVRHEGAEVWHTLTPDTAIHVGDTFHAAAGASLTLKVADKSTIRIEQNSMLILKSYNGETQFYLEHGQCKADLESPHGRFFISTPHGRVEALGTRFTVKVE